MLNMEIMLFKELKKHTFCTNNNVFMCTDPSRICHITHLQTFQPCIYHDHILGSKIALTNHGHKLAKTTASVYYNL